MSTLAAERPAADRARAWTALPDVVRTKFARLESDARHLRAAQSAAWEALGDARRALGKAEERLRTVTAAELRAGRRPAKAVTDDLDAEIAHLHDRVGTLEREHDQIRPRMRSVLQLLTACRRHLGIREGGP